MLNILNFAALVLFFVLTVVSTSTPSLAANDRNKVCKDALGPETKQEQFQRERDLHYLMKEAQHVLTFWSVGSDNYSYNLENLNRISAAAQYIGGFEHRLYGHTLRLLDLVLTKTFPQDPREQRLYFKDIDSTAVLVIGELVKTFSDVLLDEESFIDGIEIFDNKTLFYISEDIKATGRYLLEQSPEQISNALDPSLLQIEQLQEVRRIKIERIKKRLNSDALGGYLIAKLTKQLAELVYEDYLVDIYYRSVLQFKNIMILNAHTIDERLQRALLNVVYTIKDMHWFHGLPTVMFEDMLYKSFMKAYAGTDVPKPSRAQFDALISSSLPGENPSAAEHVATFIETDTTPFTIIYKNPVTDALNVLLPGISRVMVGGRNYIVQRGEYLGGQLHILLMRPLTQQLLWVNTENTLIHPESAEAAPYDDLSFN